MNETQKLYCRQINYLLVFLDSFNRHHVFGNGNGIRPQGNVICQCRMVAQGYRSGIKIYFIALFVHRVPNSEFEGRWIKFSITAILNCCMLLFCCRNNYYYYYSLYRLRWHPWLWTSREIQVHQKILNAQHDWWRSPWSQFCWLHRLVHLAYNYLVPDCYPNPINANYFTRKSLRFCITLRRKTNSIVRIEWKINLNQIKHFIKYMNNIIENCTII